MRKKKNVITPIIKQEIIDYCNGILTILPPHFLEDNSIFENEFLEYLYGACEGAYISKGDFRLTHIEIGNLVQQKKDADFTIFEIEQGRAIITAIDKFDTILFDYKEEQKKIKNEK